MFQNSIIVVSGTVLKIAPVTVYITVFENFVLIIPTVLIKLVQFFLDWRRGRISLPVG
jgi:hypothetical protein